MKRFNLLFALILLFATVNCFAAIHLPETSGKLFNLTNLENKHLELVVNFYKLKRKELGTVLIVPEKPFKTEFVKINKDGSFTIPSTKISFRNEAYVALKFRYKRKEITIKGVAGQASHEAPTMVMRVYVSDQEGYWGKLPEVIQNYMNHFKKLYLTDLSAKKESITFKTPNGESFKEYVETIIRENAPKHLQDPSLYEWMISSDAHYTVVPGNYYDDSLHVWMPDHKDAARMKDDYRKFSAGDYFGGMVTSRSSNANKSSVTSKVFIDKNHNSLYALYPSPPEEMESFCFFYLGSPRLAIWYKEAKNKKLKFLEEYDYYPNVFKIVNAELHEESRYWAVRREGTLKEIVDHYEYTLFPPEEAFFSGSSKKWK